MSAGKVEYAIDFSTLPPPVDDGGAAHLEGMRMASVALPSTDGGSVDLSALAGRVVVYVYPKTGQPGTEMPQGWDAIPGARGCTPQSCAFRDHFAELRMEGVSRLFGLATNAPSYQKEAAERLHLPFALLSDEGLALSGAMWLPTLTVEGAKLLKRMALVIDDGVIAKVFYPVFPPDRNAADVLDWLKAQRAAQ